MPHPDFDRVRGIRNRWIASTAKIPSILDAMKPTIGIPQCLDIAGRIRSGRDYLYGDVAYAREIERAGGIPIHLPPQRDVRALIDRIDGLLLPGGDDFLPEIHYPDEVCFDPAPEAQIQFDFKLLREAIERELPVLGICYGAQLIARHSGGALHHHIPLDLPEADNHQLPEHEGRHTLEVKESTRLSQTLGSGNHQINSLHHQAIARVGPGFEISGRAADGVIEAIERRNSPFCVGVQWHPEKLCDPASRSLFVAFVRESAKESQKKRN